MSSPTRIYFPAPAEVPDQIYIEGEEHHYLTHVHRARHGGLVTLFGFDTSERTAVIESIERGRTLVQLISSKECRTEPHVHLALGIAVGKGKKLEEVVETTAALGISQIIPFTAERSIAKRSNPDLTDKLHRIAMAACRQSRRTQVPEIHAVKNGLDEALGCIQTQECHLVFLDEAGGTDLVKVAWEVDTTQSIALFIGPEGGWDDSERTRLHHSDARAASLGPRILRTELAPIVAVSLLERILAFRLLDKSLF